MTEQEQQRLAEGTEARFLRQAAAPIWTALEAEIRTQAVMLARSGTLEPAQALLYWVKLATLDDVKNELETRIARAESTARRIHDVK